jgi:chitinase
VNPIYKAPSRTTPRTTTHSIFEEIDTSDLEQEDPKVIKELIELIKKAGGIEELEKQINIQEQSDTSYIKSDSKATTPASTINKSLVDKIKNRASLFKSRPPLFNGASQPEKVVEAKISTSTQAPIETPKKYNSINRFSRPQPQSAGVEKIPESDAILIEKPQYTSILRRKPVKPEVIIENDYNNDSDRNSSNEENLENNKKYASINRTRAPVIETIDTEESDDSEEVDEALTTTTTTTKVPSKYINLNRRRLTTTTEK